jgi:hypothetical protein
VVACSVIPAVAGIDCDRWPSAQRPSNVDAPNGDTSAFGRSLITESAGSRREVVYGEPIDGGTVIVRGEVLSSPHRVGQR